MAVNLLDSKLDAPWQVALMEHNPGKFSNAIELELVAFRFGTEYGRFYHMRRLVDFFFTKEFNPEIVKPHFWNPWVERFCRVICDGDTAVGFVGAPDYMGVTGPKSSGKTYAAALYSFLIWYSSPLATKVILSSTSITSAKNRIWGQVLALANAMPRQFQTYVFTGSNPAMIKLPKSKTGGGGTNVDTIELIAGDDASMEASEKIIGIKNDWVLLVVDEATEVSHAMLKAGDNLDSNPRFQMVFLGNAKSHDDPHGKICEPKKGWDTINVETEIWATTHHRGLALHFDGLKSPNLKVGVDEEPPFPKLFNHKQLQAAISEQGGDTTPGFIRFCRAFWSKGGSSNQIYGDREIELHGGLETPIWLEPPKRIAGHDVAFSSDGDKSMLVICDLGLNMDRYMQIAHVATEVIEPDDSAVDERSYGMARRLKVVADQYGIATEDIGVDNTGTGVSYPEIVDKILEGHCMRIAFNGEISDLPFPDDEGQLTEPGELFDRRVSELWYIGKLFLRKGQIKALKKSLISDMCKRLYERGRQNKICVETKRKMRERGVRSPDEADAFMIALDLARNRYGFEVYRGDPKGLPKRGENWLFTKPKKSFNEWVKIHQPNAKTLIDLKGGGWNRKVIR